MYFKNFEDSSNFEYVKNVKLKSGTMDVTGVIEVNDFQPENEIPFQKMNIDTRITRYEGDVFRIDFVSPKWKKNYAQSDLTLPNQVALESGDAKLDIDKNFNITLTNKNGDVVLQSLNDLAFGVSGEASMFRFIHSDANRYYGMGEKWIGMEHSGVNSKFWNTDVWADFSHEDIVERPERVDPAYVSVPYLIQKTEKGYVGILIDNACATYMKIGSKVNIAGQMDADDQGARAIELGAEMGQPNLIIISADTLPELTRKHQSIVGKTPLPPAWSLGYQQCRWGYESIDDLRYLDENMDKYDIPCDGLWLDIDYMDGYRVFTLDEKHFPDPVANLKEIQDKGRVVVPIIDPGVKAEPGYPVYDSGVKADAFCKNPQGLNFIGHVWPGETVFPDYSIEKGGNWWADQVAQFSKLGFKAAWLDMNDPATGSVNCMGMRYNDGKDIHETYHNQYGFGMQRETRKGFEKVNPDERIFLLSRSGFTGTSKYAAIWTGDNVANYQHLKGAISCTLNLALSGIPFNGPDAGGFGHDTNAQLMKDWYKMQFLFPFFRNHSQKSVCDQEPWVFNKPTLGVLRDYVQARYKLRPYLYNLYAEQELTGEAILRPLFYDFDNTDEVNFDYIDDQFMVGAYIMQAPFVEEKQQERNVTLPDCNWFDAENSAWLTGNKVIQVEATQEGTPLYVKEGAILPVALNEGKDFSFNSAETNFHIYLNKDSEVNAEYSYKFDDGISFEYKNGKRSEIKVTASVADGVLTIDTDLVADGFGKGEFGFVLYDKFDKVVLNGKKVSAKDYSWYFIGKDQDCQIVK